jgi:hypothetical protein
MSGQPRLYTVLDGTSTEAITGLLDVCFPDATTALDVTYGNGSFWDGTTHAHVTGLDINPDRAPDVVGDFRALPFADGSFDVCVFDPPYHTDMGRGKASVMGSRFGTFATLPELKEAVEQGCREAWRVARLGVIVKVQDYIHASRAVWMSRWVQDALPVEPYDFLHLTRRHKIVDPKWREQLSVYRNHTTFWVYRKDSNVHRRRWPAGEGRAAS